MKEEKMLRAFSLVDDELVKNAAPKGQKPNKTPIFWKKLAYIAVAACLTLAIILPFAFSGGHTETPVPTSPADLFPSSPEDTDSLPDWGSTLEEEVTQAVPMTSMRAPDASSPPDDPLEQYKESEYYPLIVKLSAYFESLVSSDGIEPMAQVLAESVDLTENEALLQETTRPDCVKTTATHLFSLKEKELLVYAPSEDGLVLAGSYAFASGSFQDFVLIDGGKKLLVFGKERYQFVKGAFTERSVLVLLDISDLANIQALYTLKASGLMDSFYEKDGCLLLINQYTIPLTPKFDQPSSFVPEIEHMDGERNLLPMDDFIMTPREITSRYYTVVYALNPETLAVMSCKVVLGAPWAVYASDAHIFVSTSRRDRSKPTDFGNLSKQVSDIQCFTYQDGSLQHRGEFTLDGWIKANEYFDEKDGVLRVVTELGYVYTRHAGVNRYKTTYIGASFYAVSLENFEVIASLEEFSNNGDDLRAVRFDGERVFVSTGLGIVGTTPLICVDFSDLTNITYTVLDDVGSYATTLVLFGNGNILGIGQGSGKNENMVEICRGESGSLVSLDRYILSNATIASEEKAYFVDTERQLVGLAASMKDNDGIEKTYYILLHFDGEKLVEVLREECEGTLSSFRAALIDGQLHLFSDAGMKTLDWNR